MIHHLTGFERFLGVAPIGNLTKFSTEGVRNGPILRPRPSSHSSSSAVDVIFQMVGRNVGSSRASVSFPSPFSISQIK